MPIREESRRGVMEPPLSIREQIRATAAVMQDMPWERLLQHSTEQAVPPRRQIQYANGTSERG